MAKAPVSCCLIADDDPHLAATVASVEPWVEEVVVLSPQRERVGVDEQGRMSDFAAARNASFARATQPWVMWLDSDDLMAQGGAIANMCSAPPGAFFLWPYEYAYDQFGRVTVRQYRERLFRRGEATWHNPVHEVLVPNGPSQAILTDHVVVRHQRQYNPKPSEPGRNLRILRRHMAAHPDDVRNAFYFGLELDNAGETDQAISWLTRYLDKSGWDDERIMAYQRLVLIHERKRDWAKALDVAFQALRVSDWFENYYAIMRQFYHQKNWERALYYGKLADSRPPTRTPLFTSSADRDELHVYLNVAYNQMGDPKSGYESTLKGLAGNPQHPHLLHNKRVYEEHLGIGRTTTSRPIDPKALDIVFVTASWEKWDPTSIKATGIGGSELMLANMARELAALGHKVRVYADPVTEGVHEGSEWIAKEKFHDLECDVLVVSRNAQYLDERTGVRSLLRLLWCHDVCAVGATPSLLGRADRVLGLSRWHCANLASVHALPPAKLVVTRNGIDLARFAACPPRNPHKIVNSSSPDRSWPFLLALFPRIRAQVPDAELHLFYGFDNWEKFAAAHSVPGFEHMSSKQLIEHTKGLIAQPGVHFHGRVSQERLTHEFLTAGLWAHPTWFTETSCITAMEARAAGCQIVTSDLAALSETVGDCGVLLNGDWRSDAYQRAFVDACVAAIAPTPHPRLYPRTGDCFALPPLAKEWETMFLELLQGGATAARQPHKLETAGSTPAPATDGSKDELEPYVPTRPYRAAAAVSSSLSAAAASCGFTWVRGSLHPQYSEDCMLADEKPLRDKYFHPKAGELFVDVGASYGAYTLTALRAGARVIAYEPEAEVVKDLRRNVEANGWKAEIHACGLSDVVGIVDVKPLMPHWPQHTITHAYPMVRLDDTDLARLDWLKVDVEGMELRVLRGAAETIRRCRPKCIVECHRNVDRDMVRKVKELLPGYSFEQVDRDETIAWLVATPEPLRSARNEGPGPLTSGLMTPVSVKLNVACGPNVFPYPGWTNYDKAGLKRYFDHLRDAPLGGMPAHQQELARFIRKEFPSSSPVLAHDMTKRFPHADGSVDFVYVGQAIEHLNRRTQAVPFLQECRRMLKPGGVLRMTTPDLHKVLANAHGCAQDQPAWFASAHHDDQVSYLLFGASGPDCTTSNYEGHFHVYSEATMRSAQEEAGFTQIAFGCSSRPEIRDEGLSHSMIVEATK